MLDIELPLWTIRPNWKDGVLERLSWLTDVMPSTYGPEQRRALRLSPRRAFEMSFNPIDEARSYFELWLHRLGSTEFMLPLFHDRGKLTAATTIHAETIYFDTTNREFVAGGLAILLGDDPFTYDKLEVLSVAPDSITVTFGNVTRAWPKGSSIHPLRRSRVEQESAAAALTSRVGQATIRFELNQANDLEDEGEWTVLYKNYPVLLEEPNRRETIDLTFQRNSLILDNDHGLTVLGDDAGRAFTLQTHSRMMRGRAEHAAFRQFLYRLRGQQGGIWIPTFNRDVQLSQPAVAADTKLDVKMIGYAYTGGAVSGRKHVLVNGTLMREISGTGDAPSEAEERLTLTAAVGTALLAGTTGSFMDTCRLAQDDIEITHHTDTDGVAECNMTFRAFRDERVPPAVLDSPIPAAAMNNDACGVPAGSEGDCYFPPMDFDGWWIKVLIDCSEFPAEKNGAYPQLSVATDFNDNGQFTTVGANYNYYYTEDSVDGGSFTSGLFTIGTPRFPVDLWRLPHDWKIFTQFGVNGHATYARVFYQKWDMNEFAEVGVIPVGNLFPLSSILHF